MTRATQRPPKRSAIRRKGRPRAATPPAPQCRPGRMTATVAIAANAATIALAPPKDLRRHQRRHQDRQSGVELVRGCAKRAGTERRCHCHPWPVRTGPPPRPAASPATRQTPANRRGAAIRATAAIRARPAISAAPRDQRQGDQQAVPRIDSPHRRDQPPDDQGDDRRAAAAQAARRNTSSRRAPMPLPEPRQSPPAPPLRATTGPAPAKGHHCRQARNRRRRRAASSNRRSGAGKNVDTMGPRTLANPAARQSQGLEAAAEPGAVRYLPPTIFSRRQPESAMDFGIGIATSNEAWKLRAEELSYPCVVLRHADDHRRLLRRDGRGGAEDQSNPVGDRRPGAVRPDRGGDGQRLRHAERPGPGRIDFGVGTGFSARRAMGLGAMKLADMEEYIRVVYGLLNGDIAGDQDRGQAAEDPVPQPRCRAVQHTDPIPLHISAYGPRSRELTAKLNAALEDAIFRRAGRAGGTRGHEAELGKQAARTDLYATAWACGCVLEPGRSHSISPRCDGAGPRPRAARPCCTAPPMPTNRAGRTTMNVAL